MRLNVIIMYVPPKCIYFYYSDLVCVEQDGDGITPLHLACMENRQNLAMILMSRGGDGAVIDSGRRTPLYYAVEKGYTRIVQTLLEYDTYMEVRRGWRCNNLTFHLTRVKTGMG